MLIVDGLALTRANLFNANNAPHHGIAISRVLQNYAKFHSCAIKYAKNYASLTSLRPFIKRQLCKIQHFSAFYAI